MTFWLATVATLLVLPSASAAFAQSGFVPTGSIVVECAAGCHIEMPAFDLVEETEPRESVSFGGLPAGAYELTIVSGPSVWDLTATVCGTTTAIRVAGDEVTVEPTSCAPFGYLAVTLPHGARADIAHRTLRNSTTTAMYVGAYDIVLTSADGDEHTDTVAVWDGTTTEVGFAAPDTTVTLVGAPLDAIVRFSGAGAFDGPGPHVVEPGLYVVEVAAPGHVATSFTLRVEADTQVEREVQLEPIVPGNARFVVSPPTAMIHIDGDTHPAGDTITLAPGDYVATVTASGYETAMVPISITSEVTTTVQVGTLSPLAVRVVITTRPSHGTVRVDGTIRRSPFSVAPGTYRLSVVADGHEEYATNLTVSAGTPVAHNVELVPSPVHVTIEVLPEYARVLVDGETFDSPHELMPGRYHIGVYAPRHEGIEFSLLIRPGVDVFRRVELEPTTSYVAISASSGHSLALDGDGQPWAWGSCGLGAGFDEHRYVTEPVRVRQPRNVRFTTVSAGDYHSLAIDEEGRAWAWGGGEEGQLGNSTYSAYETTPTMVHMPAGVRFRFVSAGSYHSLAVDEDGGVWAWGRGTSGQLGTGDTHDQVVPTRVMAPIGVTFETVHADEFVSAALDSTGTVWMWGIPRGEGHSRTRTFTAPIRVRSDTGIRFRTLSLSLSHAIALDQNGQAWTWGSGASGALGNGSSRDHFEPTRVAMPAGVRFLDVSAGFRSSQAIDQDGVAWTWGTGRYGMLGSGAVGPIRESPGRVVMPDDTRFEAITASRMHVVAIDVNGLVWSWGQGDFGRLGNGALSRSETSEPIPVAFP